MGKMGGMWSVVIAGSFLLCAAGMHRGAAGEGGGTDEELEAYVASLEEEAESEIERVLVRAEFEFHKFRSAGDAEAMGRIASKVEETGESDKDDPLCAKALVAAGNYRRIMGEGERAIELYARGEERYRGHAEWAESAERLVYCGRRRGDAYRAMGDVEKATEVWRATFEEHYRVPEAAQLPDTIKNGYRKLFDGMEAWRKGIEIYDYAIEKCEGMEVVRGLRVERICELANGLGPGYCTAEEVLREAEAMLELYPEGASEMFDKRRAIQFRDMCRSMVESRNKELAAEALGAVEATAQDEPPVERSEDMVLEEVRKAAAKAKRREGQGESAVEEVGAGDESAEGESDEGRGWEWWKVGAVMAAIVAVVLFVTRGRRGRGTSCL